MRRQLFVRIAGLTLCAVALTGCGMMGGNSDSAMAPPPSNGDNAALMATDLTAAVRQAQLLRTQGDLNGALRILSQIMLAAPDDSRVVGEYGKLLVQQGRMADAVEFLHRAIELQPGDSTLYSALGVAQDQLGDHTSAKVAYERGLALKPGDGALLNNYAMSRMLAGDPVAARTLLMQAKASGSSDPRIAQNIALLDSMTPKPLAAPAHALASAQPPARPMTAALPPAHAAPTALTAPRVPVASNGFPPAIVPAKPAIAAAAAPAPITHGERQVVMQDVPFDPLAGPVGHHAKPTAKPVKPTKLAKHAKPTPAAHAVAANVPAKPTLPARAVAANVPAKPPVKPAKPNAKDHIPALRMTADASKP